MSRPLCSLVLVVLAFASGMHAQQPPAVVDPAVVAARERLARETAEDYADMQRQLGIAAMRPGPSGNPSAPNAANTDQSKANPYPSIPAPLVMTSGARVTSARMWPRRRAEIAEAFARHVYGRVPAHVPRVTWREVRRVSTTVAGRPVRARELVGHVDNAAYPAIDVDISLMLVTPADVATPVPLMIMFRGGGLPGDPTPPGRPPSALPRRSPATIRRPPSS